MQRLAHAHARSRCERDIDVERRALGARRASNTREESAETDCGTANAGDVHERELESQRQRSLLIV